MTLPACRLLEGMSVSRRRETTAAGRSVVVDGLAWSRAELKALLRDLCAAADPALEVLVVADQEVSIRNDERLVVVRLPSGGATELRAAGINVALALASGGTIHYRTGHARLDARHTSRADITWADPHLLLRDDWAADMLRRMTGVPVPASHRDPLVLAALRRSRTRTDDDVLDAAFLDDREMVLHFRESWVAPFVRRNFPADAALAHHTIAARPLRLLVRGAIGSAGAEIIYGNFTRRYPTLLTIDGAGQKGPAVADPGQDMLVNYRYLPKPDTQLHDDFRATGRPVVYAMDDNLLRLCEMPFFSREPWISTTRRVAAHLADADMVTTWSDHCAADVSPLNPRVRALRTNIAAERLPATCSPTPVDGRIVYTTLTHNIRQRTDWWSQAATEWAAFFRTHRDRARLVLFGAGDDMHALYQQMFPGVHYELRSPLPYGEYLDAIAGGTFHFVLAQIIEDTEFVRSKCPIKLLEATAAGAVLLASHTTAYETLSDGHDCLKVAPQAGCWTDALERSLAMTPSERRTMWSAARRLVSRDFTTEAQVVELFATHHLARLHGLLGSRSQPGGRAVVLAVVPAAGRARRTVLAWAWQLRRHGLRVMVRRDGRGWPDTRPALVLAASRASGSVAWALARSIPCAALYDPAEQGAAPPSGSQPHVLLATDGHAARAARKLGWPLVRCIPVVDVANDIVPVVHDLVCALADGAFAARNN